MRMLIKYLLSTIVVISSIHFTVQNNALKGMRKIPDGLKLGVATAAFQIEGAWNVSDKTPSIWDTFSEIPGTIRDKSNAHDACKSYKYYTNDIKILKFLGVDFYRFSISWPRVLPNGFANKISKDGINYYNKIIDELLANNIDPIVTIYHWDLPQNLQNLGGWTNPLIVEWFEDYSRVLYQEFGDRVKTWITVNEPKQIAIYGYGSSRLAPLENSPDLGSYLAVKYLLLAHAASWHLYDKEFRPIQNGTCGITIATDFRQGETDSPEDIETGKLVMDFEVGLYGHPIFSASGGFPERVIRRIAEKSAIQGYPRSKLPELSKAEIEFIKGTSDFYGFNHYSTMFFTATKYKPGMYPVPSYNDDMGAVGSYLDYKLAPLKHTTSIPHGIRTALKWVRETYNNPKILITENGYGNFGGIQDDDRIDYLRSYMGAILDAIELDGCDVKCYTVWSLIDNFEWDSGYKPKLGLFEVDFKDEERTRRPRTSAYWYRRLIQVRSLELNVDTNLVYE